MCVSVCIAFRQAGSSVRNERPRTPSVPVLIYLFKYLIEVVGVYIIEVSSLNHSFSLSLSLSFYQTLKRETHLLSFLFLISLQETSDNGGACGYAALMEWYGACVYVCVLGGSFLCERVCICVQFYSVSIKKRKYRKCCDGVLSRNTCDVKYLNSCETLYCIYNGPHPVFTKLCATLGQFSVNHR